MSSAPQHPLMRIYCFFLWRFALIRLRYLCLLIFLRRFLTSEPNTHPYSGLAPIVVAGPDSRKPDRGWTR